MASAISSIGSMTCIFQITEGIMRFLARKSGPVEGQISSEAVREIVPVRLSNFHIPKISLFF